MAALQSIRGRAGLLVTVLGIALLAFILGDVLTSGSTIMNKQKDNAFSVDGDVISTGQYQERITQMEGFRKMLSNQSSLDESDMASIREMVYQQMVKERMLDVQAKKLGLAVTPQELTDMVYGDNKAPILYSLFVNPQTGTFDQRMLEYFLEGIKESAQGMSEEEKMYHDINKNAWLTIENMIKYDRLEQKYNSLVVGTVLVNNTEIDTYINNAKGEANIAYAMKYYSSIPDSTITVTDAEIKDLYNKRKSNYKTYSETRKISYFIKDVIPSDADFAAVEVEMKLGAEKLQTTTRPVDVVSAFPGNQYIDGYVGINSLPKEAKEFVESASVGDVHGPEKRGQKFAMYKLVDRAVGPDSVQLQMIGFPMDLDMRTKDHLTDSLLAVIKTGKSFADVANEINPQSNGGLLPMLDEINLIGGGLSRDVIDAPKGSVMKIRLAGQPQLVRIAEKSKPVSKVKLAVVEMPVIISSATQNAIDNELIEFINASRNKEDFEKEALTRGYSLMSDAVVHPAAPLLNGVNGTRPVIHWAFNEKAGTVKKFDTQDKRVVAIVTEVVEVGYKSLKEVQESLKRELIQDKKAEKIIADLKAKNITSLDSYATEMSSAVDTAKFVAFSTNPVSGVGFEPMFNIYSKIGVENTVTEPLKGEIAVYVLNVLDKNESGAAGLNSSIVKMRMLGNVEGDMTETATDALKVKMNVVDNRVAFW